MRMGENGGLRWKGEQAGRIWRVDAVRALIKSQGPILAKPGRDRLSGARLTRSVAWDLIMHLKGREHLRSPIGFDHTKKSPGRHCEAGESQMLDQ